MKSFKRVLLLGLLSLGLGLAGKPAFAAGSSYTVNLTTYVPSGALAGSYTLGAFPNITGNLYVRKIIVSASTSTVIQTITAYDLCAATTTAAVDLKFYLGTVNASNYAVPNVEYNFLPQSWKLTSPCFIKSDTGSSVQLTVFYE